MITLLSIAGFDPSGGAGVLADIKTFAAFGCYGTAAITSLTSQNTVAVYGASHSSAEVLRAQIDPIVSDFNIAAVKIGMLPSMEIVEIVSDTIERHELKNVVVDPVICSSSGYELIDANAVKLLIERILPLADVITPNIPEAERLTGLKINNPEEMKGAARALHLSCASQTQSLHRQAVLVKGGHLPAPFHEDATDVLDDGREFHLFQAKKIATRGKHGTGCTLSSAIAALLARGHEIPEAVGLAKRYLEAALRAAPEIGHGAGPLNHFCK
ncbi:MAG: bifunctional hydroxymethylpyrimidine kinase/phosphomethylpyrimidine kinase [Blastocatellia bacterium]|nr:bifunctional hydroxymethylpyrimidine kinase/phosphomethylpyrimidine kinase [Blastocatellia bacterium]